MLLKNTLDIPCPQFEKKLVELCNRNGWHWRHLLGVMMSESGLSSKAHNDNPKTKTDDKGKVVPTKQEERYNAVGLIQFMPATLKALGFQPNAEQEARGLTRWEAMLELDAVAQLPWVERYFLPYKSLGLNSAGRFYQATFLPATLRLGSDPNLVLTAKGGPLGWAYSANAVFDTNKDGRITVGELEAAIERNCKGARWAEMLQRFGAPAESSDAMPIVDLSTMTGVQAALKQLGYYKGEVDGLFWAKSRAALAAFQKDAKIKVDGIYGPQSKAALTAALQ